MNKLSIIKGIKQIHWTYFSPGNDSFLNIMDRDWYIGWKEGHQSFMIETAVPWGGGEERTTVYSLKAFSKDKKKTITIGRYEEEQVAINVMTWLRVNDIFIESEEDIANQKESLESIFAKPIL